MTNTADMRGRIQAILEVVVDQRDEQLAQAVWPTLKGQLALGELAGSSPVDAIVEWSQTELPRLCKKAAETGAKVMSYVKDASTQHDAERLAIVAVFLLEHFANAHLELHAAVAMAVLIIRHTGRDRAPRH